jgi:hypothetical protein
VLEKLFLDIVLNEQVQSIVVLVDRILVVGMQKVVVLLPEEI